MKYIQSNIQFQTDKSLIWKQQINHVAVKLSEATAKLSSLRHVFDIKTLRSVYYAILKSFFML